MLIPTEKADVSISNAIELVKIISSETARISVVMDEDVLLDIIEQLGSIPALFIASGKKAPEFLEKVLKFKILKKLFPHFPMPLQTFSERSPSSSQIWVLEAESPDQFVTMMEGVDIPIDSSVLVYSGKKSAHLDIYDVYRSHPSSEIR